MTDFTDEGLVLDTLNYRDRDLLLSVLTPHHGVVRGVFRRARGGRAPRAAATQLLSQVQCSIHQWQSADLADFREVDPITSSFGLTTDFNATTVAAAVAELLLIFCPAGEPAPRRYRLGVAILKALLDGVSPDGALAYTQLWTLKLGGFLQPVEVCSTCGARLTDSAVATSLGEGLRCRACAPSGHRLGAPDLEALRSWIQAPPSAISGDPPAALRQWLDRTTQDAAERRLKALDFHRRHCIT
ncbi:MAG: DNA repair protein RecO [Acidobacteria bacterium]|nr:DNA repair protein RecO [Acidobacteriota bacterium]